jgi:hypothetical protein
MIDDMSEARTVIRIEPRFTESCTGTHGVHRNLQYFSDQTARGMGQAAESTIGYSGRAIWRQ